MDHSFSQSWRVESQDNSLFGTIRDSSPFIVDYSLGLHMGMSKKRGHAFSCQGADPLTLLTFTAHRRHSGTVPLKVTGLTCELRETHTCPPACIIYLSHHQDKILHRT